MSMKGYIKNQTIPARIVMDFRIMINEKTGGGGTGENRGKGGKTDAVCHWHEPQGGAAV